MRSSFLNVIFFVFWSVFCEYIFFFCESAIHPFSCVGCLCIALGWDYLFCSFKAQGRSVCFYFTGAFLVLCSSTIFCLSLVFLEWLVWCLLEAEFTWTVSGSCVKACSL